MIRASVVFLLLLPVGYLSIANAWSHPASSVTATATANVVEDIAITSEQPLNFGFVTPSKTAGTVTVSAQDKRLETGGARASSYFNRAVFSVRGMPGRNYTIHAPSSVIFSAKAQEKSNESKHLISDLMVKDFITYSTTAQTAATTGKLGRNGQDRIYLGATLIVPADAAPGVYSGWVPLTVSY